MSHELDPKFAQDRVSVVIASYNRARYLPRAVESVLAQSHADVELVVVDDGSTDDTREVLARYGSGVRIVRQPNRERGAARNTGIGVSTGEFLAFLDSDDMWEPPHLERLVEALRQEPHVGVAYTDTACIDELSRTTFFIYPTRPVNGDAFLAAAAVSPFALSSALVRRSVLSRTGTFCESRLLAGAEDWEFWVRCLNKTPVRYVPGTTVRMYFHKDNTTSDPFRMERALRAAAERMRAHPEVRARLIPRERQLRAALVQSICRHYVDAGQRREAVRRLVGEVARAPMIALTTPAARAVARIIAGPRRPIERSRT